MLHTGDLVNLPYSADLTEAGIAYACRSLAFTYDRMGGSSIERMQRIAAGKAVELAFRRWLQTNQVPHDNLGSTPFTDPDHYDIAVGGHRCDLKSFLINEKKRIKELSRSPHMLLDAEALVPSDQFAAQHLGENDLYIFAFVYALLNPHQNKPGATDEIPYWHIHPLPAAWARPEDWRSLSPLAVKSESGPPLLLTLGGQTAGRLFLAEQVSLPPQTILSLHSNFYSLAYLHAAYPPTARIGIHSAARKETYVAAPHQWGNIWVYGLRIVLAGWISRGEFRQQASLLPPGSSTFQYHRTRTENRAVPMHALHPMGDFVLSSR